MNRQESKFQPVFAHWLKTRLTDIDGGFAFELKHTRGERSMPFSAVEEHQIDALLAASTTGIIYKISDESRAYKPFDCFALKGCKAYVVIRYPDFFVLIPIQKFLDEKNRSEAKSLTEERAKAIASVKVVLKKTLEKKKTGT